MFNILLLAIDPQFDFCNPKGALYVPGANKDMGRLANLVNSLKGVISDISITLDTHHYNDIAHPGFWKDMCGNEPSEFQIIKYEDVRAGIWLPKREEFTTRVLQYLKALERDGLYNLCIWPPHCIWGTKGASIYEEFGEALQNWCRARSKVIDYVVKGTYQFAEHYGAFEAEVTYGDVPETLFNNKLLEKIHRAEIVLIAGEASSHCVRKTVSQIAQNTRQFGKYYILRDCMSSVRPVGGLDFPKLTDDFFLEMQSKGMKLTTSTEIISTMR